MSRTILQIDAFTASALAGNPCTVVMDADDLDAPTMLAIAREMNLAETAFVRTSEKADIGARYFTPSEEIPMAGHPTIATAFALVETGRIQLGSSPHRFELELPVGVLPVEIFHEAGKVVRIRMTQQKPRFLNRYRAEDTMPAFGLGESDVYPNAVIQTVSTGTPMIMVPVKDLDTLRRAKMDVPLYQHLKDEGDFFSPHLFCPTGVTQAGDTFARHFGVPPDLPEDPFTGSATGAMAAYLWRYGLLDKPNFTAEQGHWMDRPGQAQVEVVGPRDNIETVKISGSAVTVLRGELYL